MMKINKWNHTTIEAHMNGNQFITMKQLGAQVLIFNLSLLISLIQKQDTHLNPVEIDHWSANGEQT